MFEVDSLESLNKISSTVSERDKKIWENEAHSVCIKKVTEELKKEIIRMKRESDEIENENKILETRLEEILHTVAVQKETLKTSEKSILVHKTLLENLIQERDEMESKYAHLLQMYEDEYNDYRNIYINSSKSYQDLREKQIELKKMKITGMNLDVKISCTQRSLKQFKDIQKQMLQTTIIKFANFFVLYHKNIKIQTELQERKNEEKNLMMEHLELMKMAKEKKTQKVQDRNKNRMMQSLTTDVEEKASEKNTEQRVENKDSSAEMMQKFLNEEIELFSSTPIESTSQQSEFNQDYSKVRILDMKIMKSMPLQINVVNKPDLQLRKKMESIIETTRKNALRPPSAQVTPSGSQQSQRDTAINGTLTKRFQNSGENCEPFIGNLSQNSEKLSLTPKEKVPINPILKHPKERPNQCMAENADICKDETTSKFFVKKKNVTFQTESITKPNQERCDMLENRFTFQIDKNQDEKHDPLHKLPCGINKENMKPVELKSMDVFRKPFNFLNESITKHEKKKSDTTLIQNSHFGMFAQSQEKNESSPDFDTVLNSSNHAVFGSSTVPFTVPSEVDQPQDQTFDPFEASCNLNSFAQSPLNTTEEFNAPASQSHTFNFFGSQNKSNPFTMF